MKQTRPIRSPLDLEADTVEQSGPMPTACRLWRWAKHNWGYGQVQHSGAWRYAHRVFYEMLVGPIAPGMTLDHLCRVPACINPEHLEQVTIGENVLRGNAVSGVNRRKVACPQGHQYDAENTYTDKRGKRHCRACCRDRMRANYRLEAQP